MESIDKTQCSAAPLCPICGNKSSIIDKVKTINPESDDTVDLRKCSACDHWWIDPLPKQEYLSRLYADNSLFAISKGYDEESKSSLADINSLEEYTGMIFTSPSKQNKPNFLEIGVGSGHLFNYVADKVNMRFGVEPGSWKPSHPNIVTDIGLIPKDIKFDIIVVQDVLEHLASPVAILKKLRSVANSGCVITLGFPNKDSLPARLFKGKWRMIRPLGHIHFFSSKSILRSLQQSGWKIVFKQKCRPAHLSLSDAARNFDWKLFRNPLRGFYRLVKVLLINELFLEKDQWLVQAIAK